MKEKCKTWRNGMVGLVIGEEAYFFMFWRNPKRRNSIIRDEIITIRQEPIRTVIRILQSSFQLQKDLEIGN